MAELVAFAIAAYPAFSTAWNVLQYALGVVDYVGTRQSQMKCLLSRCKVLMMEMGCFLREEHPDELTDSLQNILRYVLS